jgi:metal-responsive CopG/Arc/MetJ family transcriptional regulator
MGMAAGNISLPEPLMTEIQSAADAQHRTADDLAADAVRQYLEKQSWVQFVEQNERRAKELGITEDDIPRLIAEVRRENKERQRR